MENTILLPLVVYLEKYIKRPFDCILCGYFCTILDWKLLILFVLSEFPNPLQGNPKLM